MTGQEIHAWLPDRAVLLLSGEEVRPFLQALVTTDINRLAPERALWAALLTPQGKYLFDFFLVERDGEILLETAAPRLPELQQRLTLYRLRAKVRFSEPQEPYGVVVRIGPTSPAAPAGRSAGEGPLLRFTDPRHADLGERILAPRSVLEKEFGPLSGLQDRSLHEQRRIRLAAPDSLRDLEPGRSLPLEHNFAELHGVDFDKGCFIGQEVSARMKHRGRLRRRLLPVEIEGPASPGAVIRTAEEREAGTLRSLEGTFGLALLRLDRLGEPEGLHCGEGRVRPLWPPWLDPAHPDQVGTPPGGSP